IGVENAVQSGHIGALWDKVQQLVHRKDELERGGMNEPLVDAEGYPHADVDVYQVHAARDKIICLQNDHKVLMLQVEKALHQLHAREKEKQAKYEPEAQTEAMNQNQSLPQPFAGVNAVTPGSPASISGLQVDDEIIEWLAAAWTEAPIFACDQLSGRR
uniref:Nas2 N-terminal domain-containing protein n=1 Tax=Chelonoidis abingdonii TaxID=106734 RepID=A0A8C0HH08_CHEAB